MNASQAFRAFAAAIAVVGLSGVVSSGRAATLTVTAAPGLCVPGEDAFAIQFDFGPIAVPGPLTAVEADFAGSVYAGIEAPAANGTVKTVTVIPQATFGDSFSDVLEPVADDQASGTQVTLPMAGGVAVSRAGQAITLSGNFGANDSLAEALASGPFVIEVDLFSTLDGFSGSGAIGGAEVRDDSNGIGQLTLTLSYDPVAAITAVSEPASFALLGMPLAGLGLLRRRKLGGWLAQVPSHG